jgi:hypothetical protein
MRKDLMSLSVLVLVAIAFAAIPALASSGEFVVDCKSGASCSGSIAGGLTEFQNTAGEGISCTSSTGTLTWTSGSSTGTSHILLHGCRENVTIFKFSCNGPGLPSGTTTITSTVHAVKIFGLILVNHTNISHTTTCAGFSDKTVTGNVMGLIENPNCGTFRTSHAISFEKTGVGQQKYKQVTEVGTIYDLISNNDAGGQYTTTSLTGTMSVTYSGGNEAKITC